MAEAVAKVEETNTTCDKLECAVCLQPCVHPAQLPCGHIFCYLCVKGFANQNKRCAMCRQEIPVDFIDQPRLLQAPQPQDLAESFDGGYQWFYEGRNGWWQYDERTSKEMENSYKNEDKTIELLIAGFLYVVDFENMVQIRRNDPSKRRQIKRDFSTICKKGVAGIRTSSPCERPALEMHPASSTDLNSVLPATPSNSPQSPSSGQESPNGEANLQATVDLISNLSNLTLNCLRQLFAPDAATSFGEDNESEVE